MLDRPVLLLLAAVTAAALAAALLLRAVTGPAAAEAGPSAQARFALEEAEETLDLPGVAGDDGRPLVVIDPGHGGFDPGATNADYREKEIVLALAQALRDRLLAEGDVRVALTRDDDRYLAHAERFGIARRLEADLFVSIHADSGGGVDTASGASIYTLSDEASSRDARRFAERENRAERINGRDIGSESDTVSAILFDLSQRRIAREADAFADLIEREGEGLIRFRAEPRRSAALKVLRAPDVPSVLFEAGFITNAADAERLASAEGRARFAEAMANAIRIHFIRQEAAAAASTATATDDG